MAVESSRTVVAYSLVVFLASVNFVLQGCNPESGFLADSLAASGFVEKSVEHEGASRRYVLYVPSSVTSDNPPQGLVLFLHGFSVSVENTCDGQNDFSFDVVAEANEKGYIAVCAEGLGTPGRFDGEGIGWNNDICCGKPVGKSDDVGFIRTLLDDVRDNVLPTEHEVKYPERNVFAFGFSTGGLFSYRLACELSDHINGIAPIGATWNHAFGTQGDMPWADNCDVGVPIYESIGTNDQFTTSELAETKWREYSTQKLSCDEASATTFKPAGESISCYAYSNCGGSDVAKSQLCVYEDMIHTVRPTKVDFDFGHTAHAWDFLVAATAQR
jgi:polyhydroxybutyrate depolymerase